jgi:hypothetical protein
MLLLVKNNSLDILHGTHFMKLAAVSLLFSFSAFATAIEIKDYNWPMTNISSRGLSKEALFSRMDRNFIKTSSSICSNRALMWAHNFKKDYNLDSGKIFLFYTKKKGEVSLKTWWYHVAPVINENGKVWVMEAGFPGWISSPLTKENWLYKFSDSTNCKEIQAKETELVELIFRGQVFPHQTSYGYHDCYFKIVPHSIWTPEVLAQNLLGRDRSGRPVRVERSEIDSSELYQSCLEATSTKIEYALGTNKKKCKEYAGIVD